MHGPGVNLPLGKFLLIRKGNQVGALRLTKITNDTATKPKANEWLGTIYYESYFTDSPGSIFSANTGKHVDAMHFGVIKGFGFHYSWQSGNREAIVGPWKFQFFNQDGMFMNRDDAGLEFAPTNATDMTQLDPKSTSLNWFRYDNDRDIPCPMPLPPTAHSSTHP